MYAWYFLKGSLVLCVQTLKNVHVFWPINPLKGIYPKAIFGQLHKDMYTRIFVETLFMGKKKWKEPKYPSMRERINHTRKYARTIKYSKRRSVLIMLLGKFMLYC